MRYCVGLSKCSSYIILTEAERTSYDSRVDAEPENESPAALEAEGRIFLALGWNENASQLNEFRVNIGRLRCRNSEE